MTQTMSSPGKPSKLYYRAQTIPHPNHTESTKFTNDAKNNYAEFNKIQANDVEVGTYQCGQGVPTAKNRFMI